jgi:predicted nucleic acid-binding protein
MIVVSDNSPLQYLILIGCIDALPILYGRVLTTPQVIEELNQSQTPDVVRRWTQALPEWIKVESPSRIDFLDAVDVGEASAISLARERRADLVLIDERAGTETARRAGMMVVGTLGVLIDAGAEGLIEFEPSIERLTETTSFYASRTLIAAARRIFHERTSKGSR